MKRQPWQYLPSRSVHLSGRLLFITFHSGISSGLVSLPIFLKVNFSSFVHLLNIAVLQGSLFPSFLSCIHNPWWCNSFPRFHYWPCAKCTQSSPHLEHLPGPPPQLSLSPPLSSCLSHAVLFMGLGFSSLSHRCLESAEAKLKTHVFLKWKSIPFKNVLSSLIRRPQNFIPHDTQPILPISLHSLEAPLSTQFS